MPGEESSGISSALVLAMGAGRRWSGAAECEHAETNARVGEAKVASRGGCQDLEDHSARRVCHAGWQLSNRRWAVYLPQQCNLGTPSRSAHGPTRNYSACRQRSHGYLRQSERTARARKRSFRTGDSCDLMRARRRRWQIRVRAGDMRSEVEAGVRTINEHRNEQNQMPNQDWPCRWTSQIPT